MMAWEHLFTLLLGIELLGALGAVELLLIAHLFARTRQQRRQEERRERGLRRTDELAHQRATDSYLREQEQWVRRLEEREQRVDGQERALIEKEKWLVLRETQLQVRLALTTGREHTLAQTLLAGLGRDGGKHDGAAER